MRLKHEPLRVPEKWAGQDRAFVIQLERQLEDIYNRLGKIMEAETALKEAVSALDDRVAALEE